MAMGVDSHRMEVKDILTLLSGAVGGAVGSALTFAKLKREYRLEDRAEDIAHALLSDERWRLRSFAVIRHHLGGFPPDDLRKILVRSGGIRFKSKNGTELWGLLTRNRDRLGVTKVDSDPENLNELDLFDT
jgi:hypothetical protein